MGELILGLSNSFIVREPDRFAGYLIIVGALFLLFSVVNGVNLSVGQCVIDMNSSVQYCAPANLAGQVIQLSYPSFGVNEKLNYSCSSGELVKNAVPSFQNVNLSLAGGTVNASFVPYFNFSIACWLNQTVLNESVYVNNSVVVERKPRLDKEVVQSFGGRFWDYDMNLSVQCPEFPKINDIWMLAPSEKRKVDEYNLIVTCANSSEMCPVSSVVNESCVQSSFSIDNLSVDQRVGLCASVGFVQPSVKPESPLSGSFWSGWMDNYLLWLVVGVVLFGGAGWYFDNEKKKKLKVVV